MGSGPCYWGFTMIESKFAAAAMHDARRWRGRLCDNAAALDMLSSEECATSRRQPKFNKINNECKPLHRSLEFSL